jgi:parvulin-like peptidyl-prolyl isomerase
MNSKKLLATLAISTMLLTGCVFNQKDTIIKVNGQNITQSQFDSIFNKEISNSMFARMGVDIKKDKNGFLYLMIKDKVVNGLIVKSLINQEIEKRNIKITKEDTDKELKLIMDKIGSKEKFNEILKQNGISSEQFKKDLDEEVKMKKLIETLSNTKISEEDAKKFYNENLDKFKYPDRVRASHILISANSEEIRARLTSSPKDSITKEEVNKMVEKELAEKLEKAKKLLTEVKKDPTLFEKIARENSDDTTSAKQGGDLGFFSRQEMVEPFSKAAFSQKPNTISEGIVKSPYGYHIILVKDKMKAGQEPFEKVKPEIMAYLEDQARIKVLENLIQSLKNQAKIEYVNQEYNPINIQEELKQQTQKPAGNPQKSQGTNPPPPPLAAPPVVPQPAPAK